MSIFVHGDPKAFADWQSQNRQPVDAGPRSAGRFPKRHPEPGEAITRNRQHAVDRRFQFEFPVSAVGLQAEESNAGNADGVLPVDSYESKGFKQWCDFAERPEIDKRCARTKANLGLPASGFEGKNVTRVKNAVLIPRDVDEDSMRCHTTFVARVGCHEHRMVVFHMGW